MSTQTDIENLVYNLNLSPYQATEIYRHRNEYDLSRIEMRGDVLYVPRVCNMWQKIIGCRTGDVIGKQRTLLRGAHRIRLIAGGYYTGQLGQSVYYGMPDGRAIQRTAFDSLWRANR